MYLFMCYIHLAIIFQHDSEDYRYIALSRAEFVPNLPRDIACVYKSDTAIDSKCAASICR